MVFLEETVVRDSNLEIFIKTMVWALKEDVGIELPSISQGLNFFLSKASDLSSKLHCLGRLEVLAMNFVNKSSQETIERGGRLLSQVHVLPLREYEKSLNLSASYGTPFIFRPSVNL
ncbi:unnamed protein product [Linum trigynum]|uniref:Uncharacterized protein n=1 Tax=Linum trigynum TaxID=586398 RepID=A0AAV2CYI9_9ROSI